MRTARRFPRSSFFRTLVAASAGLALAACGGGDSSPSGPGEGPPPPTPSISVTLSFGALTIMQGDDSTATVTVTRNGNYAGQVTLSAEGLPPGVTATFNPATLEATATTGTLTLTSDIASAPGAYTLTVRGSGTGVAPATQGMALTVQARPAPQVPVASVQIVALADTIEAFDQLALGAVVRDAQNNVLTGRTVTWASSHPTVATVDPLTGLVTGVDRGTVTIRATSEGKFDAESLVVVIRYRQITVGTQHACDISSGGRVYCWGLNGNEGRVGSQAVGPTNFHPTPQFVPIPGRVVQLSTWGRHTCAVNSLGKAYCWGYNGWGALGANSNLGSSPTPLAVAGNTTFRQVSAGADHACGVATDNRAYCWGHNDWGQFGTGQTGMSAVPVAVGGNLSFFSITTGSSFTCGITTGAETWCWGANSTGQLGDGGQIAYGNVYVATPQRVVGGHTFNQVALGNQYACARNQGGQAYCWGSNNSKFGNGPGGDSSSPVPVSGGLSFRQLTTGFSHACGVASDDSVWCWGSNGNGQLGVTLVNGSNVPVRAGGSLRAAEVSAAGIATGSGSFTCAIGADRLTAWCWGRNDLGQLGNGATSTSTAVNAVPSIVVGQKPL